MQRLLKIFGLFLKCLSTFDVVLFSKTRNCLPKLNEGKLQIKMVTWQKSDLWKVELIIMRP